MKKAFTAFTVGIFYLAAQPAHAQVINDAGAAKLKTIFQEMIDDTDRIYKNIPILKLNHEGDLIVTPHNGYYQVVWPEYAIEVLINKDNKILFDLGKTVTNVVPEGDDALNMSIASAMPILGTDSSGMEFFRLDIGQQKGHAIYVPSIKSFPQYQFSYQDIKVTFPQADVTLTIDNIDGMMDLKADASGYYSGSGKFSASALKLAAPSETDDSLFIEIDDILVTDTTETFDLARYKKFLYEILETDPTQFSPEEHAAYSSGMLTHTLTLADGGDTDFSLNNLKVNFQPSTGKAMSFSVKDAGFGFGLTGMRGEKGSFRLSGKLNGLEIPDSTAPSADFIPSHAAYNMRIVDIPVKGLMSVLNSALQPHTRTMPPDIREIKQMLSDAGTKYILENNDVDMPAFGSSLAGEAKANSAAAFGLTALFQGHIRNLDEFIAKYQPQLSGLPIVFQQIYTPLAMVMNIGKLDTDTATGQSARHYEIEITPAGNITINGQDMMMLMSGGGTNNDQQPPIEQTP